jgi:general secretion pathway protein D
VKPLLAGVLAAVLAAAPLGAPVVLAQEQVLNVQDADIRAFIQDVARTTGMTFIIDPRVRGTVSVSSNGPISRSELFEVFLSTLRANGLTATPTGAGAYRIAPAEGVAQQPSGPGAVRFSTQVFRLRNIEAPAAVNLVKPLVGAQGQVIGSAQGNVLVVADYADNLTRIRALVAQIDQDHSSVEAVTLRYSSAREISTVLNELVSTGERGRSGLVTVLPVDSSNSILLRGDPAAVQRLLPIIADLDRRAEARGDIQVVRLQHADAGQVLPVLQQIVGQQPTTGSTTSSTSSTQGLRSNASLSSMNPTSAAPSGSSNRTEMPAPVATGAAGGEARIARFLGANALVISAPPELQRTLVDVIHQLDVRREQVLVEAIVVEVSDNAARQLGLQWMFAGRDGLAATNFSNMAPSAIGIAGAVAGAGILPDAAVSALQQQAVSDLVNSTGITAGGGGSLGNDVLFGAVLNAVKTDSASNLLSTPSVLTLDNEEARILVGQEIPITVGEVLSDTNTNPFRTVQRKNVGVELEVRPQINAGGAITLYLRQEVSSVAGPVTPTSNDLVTNTRTIETTALVDDGDIVVLGGLIGQDQKRSTEKVPGLGDVPVIGGLFRSNGKETGRTNLMVFIRPRIIRSPSDAQAATAPRYDYIRAQQAKADPTGRSSLEALLRDYMQTMPPAVPATPAP